MPTYTLNTAFADIDIMKEMVMTNDHVQGLNKAVEQAKKDTNVRVEFPAFIPKTNKKYFASIDETSKQNGFSYMINIDATPDCNGAKYCNIGRISARKNAQPEMMTDRNKRKLVKESGDMICILEDAFELVQGTEEFKIFKNMDYYVGIVFYEDSIDEYKKTINKIRGHFKTYVFSMGDDPHTREFMDIKDKVTLCAIPEVILKVYREIFK